MEQIPKQIYAKNKMELTMEKEGMVYKKDLICDICGVLGAYPQDGSHNFIDDDMLICKLKHT